MAGRCRERAVRIISAPRQGPWPDLSVLCPFGFDLAPESPGSLALLSCLVLGVPLPICAHQWLRLEALRGRKCIVTSSRKLPKGDVTRANGNHSRVIRTGIKV